MKKIFIGLLIIAAGAGAYYFLQNKKPSDGNTIQQELLIGKWKLDTVSVPTNDSSTAFTKRIIKEFDSGFIKHQYDFHKTGNVLLLLNDTVTIDTSYYEWNKRNELLWKETPAGQTIERLNVIKLGKDSLVLQSIDSARFFFTKII